MTVSHRAKATLQHGLRTVEGQPSFRRRRQNKRARTRTRICHSPLSSFSHLWFLRVYQRHFDQVLTEEPCLQFVGAQYIAHHHVIGSVIPNFIGAVGQLPAFPDDDLVRIQQPRNLNRHFFPAARRALNLVVSAMSGAMASDIPPSNWIRSAMVSTISTCSSKCLSNKRCN